ncbi:MAG: WD40/YVTN/BNR-like repeat-containing protein [Thermoleophilia bacterium]
MKRLLPFKLAFALAVLIALVFAMPASSAGLFTGDGSWQWSNPSVQGNTINSISFVDGQTGYAAGIGGTVIKTTNGGANWTAKIPSTSCGGVVTAGCNLSGIHFFSATEGWVVGDYGTIWHTINGGDSWTSQTANLPASGCAGGGTCTSTLLKDIHFSNSSNLKGLAVGDGYAFGTIDGGATWTKVNSIGTSHYLASVNMLSPTSGVIVGSDGSIYTVTESGGTWTATPRVSGTIEALRSVYFNDDQRGFAVGGNKLLRTTNGGITWEVGTLAGGTAQLWGVTVSGNDLIVTGGTAGAGNGAIYKRTSASNWTDPIATVAAGLSATSTGTTSQILAVAMPTASTGYAAGEAGAITKTTSTGSTWTLKAGGNAKGISGASFISDTTGWMVATDGSVMKTIDAGNSWVSDSSGIPANTKLQAVQFVDAATGWAVGLSGSSGVAYKYSSGTWSAVTLPAGVGSLWGIHMTDATHGWMVGIPGSGATTGVALRTTDGSTWAFEANGIGTDIQLTGVDSSDASTNGWAVGQKGLCNISCTGVLLKYSGGTWTSIEKTDTSFFTSIDMVNDSTGYAVGYSGGPPAAGRGYKTIDGGASWNSTPVGTSKLLSDVSFVDANNGYASGDEGRVIKTTNGGTSWTLESIGSSVGMNTIVAVPSLSSPTGIAAFVGGFNGAVLRKDAPDPARNYFWTWYDNIGGDNWVLMANPVSASQNLTFNLFIGGGSSMDLSGYYNDGIVAPGASITPIYSGVIDGPVKASSTTGGKGIVSQRILWPKGGNSLEEVLGTDSTKLSNHFYWTWYDDLSTGYTNYIMVANPGTSTVYYRIRIAGENQADFPGMPSSGSIAPGQSAFWRDGSKRGGPVEVIAWSDSVDGSVPADVLASQRVLTNGGSAFNELPGTPDTELSDRYEWTWYDNHSPGAQNWIMIANHNAAPLYYEISIGGVVVQSDATAGGAIPPGSNITPTFKAPTVPAAAGPVEVRTYAEATHTTPMNSIASQRVIWGPSFGEVPGYPYSALTNTYHWTWYDQSQANVYNWVMVSKQDFAATNVWYKVLVAGVERKACTQIPAEGRDTPVFPGVIGGPVEVRSYSDNFCTEPSAPGNGVMASQRVLWKGYFNETLGTDLS